MARRARLRRHRHLARADVPASTWRERVDLRSQSDRAGCGHARSWPWPLCVEPTGTNSRSSVVKALDVEEVGVRTIEIGIDVDEDDDGFGLECGLFVNGGLDGTQVGEVGDQWLHAP